MKKIVLVLSLLLVGILLTFLSLKFLIRYIYENDSCALFNIDHIELRVPINIPTIEKSTCNYNAEKKLRIATFTLDSAHINLSEYCKRYNLQTPISHSTSFKLLSPPNEQTATLSGKVGKRTKHNWEVLLDHKTNTLSIAIQYLD